MTYKRAEELQAEFDRLQALLGPVMIRPCCETCSKVSIRHVATGIIASSKMKRSPIENGIEALRLLSKSLFN